MPTAKSSLTGNALDVDESLSLTPSVEAGQLAQTVQQFLADKLTESQLSTLILPSLSAEALTVYLDKTGIAYLAYALSVSCGELISYELVMDAHSGELLIANCETKFLDSNISSATIDLPSQNEADHKNVLVTSDETQYYLIDSKRNIYGTMADNERMPVTFWTIFAQQDFVSNEKIGAHCALGKNETLSNRSVADAYVHTQITYDYFAELLHAQPFGGGTPFPIKIVDNVEFAGEDAASSEDYGSNMFSCFRKDIKTDVWSVIIGIGQNTYKTFSKNLDRIAHEYMHAIETIHSRMASEGESGAIREAICDIFGELVEGWYYQKEPNWKQSNKRNLKNPAKDKCPSVYLGKDWLDVNHSDKDAFVHKNSTVLSHAAYLMRNGGEDGNGTRLSLDELAQLWYHAMLMMPSDCNFYECRSLVELAARHLHFSDAKKQTIAAAFDEVGVQKAATPDYILAPNGTVSVLNNQKVACGDFSITIVPMDYGPMLVNQAEEAFTKTQTAAEPFVFPYTAGSYAVVLRPLEGDATPIFFTVTIADEGGSNIDILADFGKQKERLDNWNCICQQVAAIVSLYGSDCESQELASEAAALQVSMLTTVLNSFLMNKTPDIDFSQMGYPDEGQQVLINGLAHSAYSREFLCKLAYSMTGSRCEDKVD